jgi:hypothetical protein
MSLYCYFPLKCTSIVHIVYYAMFLVSPCSIQVCKWPAPQPWYTKEKVEVNIFGVESISSDKIIFNVDVCGRSDVTS